MAVHGAAAVNHEVDCAGDRGRSRPVDQCLVVSGKTPGSMGETLLRRARPATMTRRGDFGVWGEVPSRGVLQLTERMGARSGRYRSVCRVMVGVCEGVGSESSQDSTQRRQHLVYVG